MPKNFKKINLFEPLFDKDELSKINNVIKSGWVTNGPTTIKFENKVKKILNARNAIAVNSCTNGIIATIAALNLKPGDEVLTSPMTFVSVIHALEIFKLKIKLVDINFENFSLNYDSIEKQISSKTKLVIVTHYGGIPVRNTKIENFCKNRGIFLIEDAATSFGSKIKNKMTGSSKYAVSVFSFYANKIITTGEGGVITCYNDKLAKKIRSITSCGIDRDPWKRKFEKRIWFYKVKRLGFKFNFTDLQASIGLAQIKKLKKIIAYRKQLRKIYDKSLQILFKKGVLFFQNKKKDFFGSEYIYTIFINQKGKVSKRDKLVAFLKKRGISTTVHYIPANFHDFYKKKFKKYNLPNSDKFFHNVISLPFHNNLNENEIIRISNIIKNFFKNEK